MTHKSLWQVEEYKIWKGIDPNKPTWASLNIVCDDWHQAKGYVDFLSRNKPEGVFRVNFANMQPAPPADPAGYLFELFYPGSNRWSGAMFSDHDPTVSLPAEHIRNVRPLYTLEAAQ